MKHLRKFENFDLGHRFSEEEEEMQIHRLKPEEEEEECKPCASEEEEEYEEEEKNWNDEEELRLEKVISFRQFEAKKAKPDFLDLDKDGNKKESMKKAAKDAKDAKEDDKKEEKGGKGLTAAQKKLPEGLRKAIEAKKKK